MVKNRRKATLVGVMLVVVILLTKYVIFMNTNFFTRDSVDDLPDDDISDDEKEIFIPPVPTFDDVASVVSEDAITVTSARPTHDEPIIIEPFPLN